MFRHWKGFASLPWLFAAIVDCRRPLLERQKVAQDMFDPPPLELRDEWFSQILLGNCESWEYMFAPTRLHGLWLWSWQVLLSICQTEFQHGRNRARSHQNMTWANCVANAFAQESMLRCRRQYEGLRSAMPPRVSALAIAQQPKRTRKLTPKDVFRLDLVEQKKRRGEKVYVASAAFWREVREGWAHVQANPAELQKYEVEAQLSLSAAEARRLSMHPAEEEALLAPPPNPPAASDAPKVALLDAPVDITCIAAAKRPTLEVSDTCPIDVDSATCRLPISLEGFEAELFPLGGTKKN